MVLGNCSGFFVGAPVLVKDIVFGICLVLCPIGLISIAAIDNVS